MLRSDWLAIMFSPVTIKDVALVAGVHFTTVSMALRGHPAIAQLTRRRIEAIARRIGYRRSEVFTALSRQRKFLRQTRSIPSLLYLGRANSDRQFFEMAHHRQMLIGARREAEALGYKLLVRRVGPGGLPPEQLQTYLSRTAALGVVIGAWDPALNVPLVDWSRLAAVKIDSRHVLAQVPLVSFDQMKCVIRAHDQLTTLGYKRIGLALGEKDEDATDGLHLSGWFLSQSQRVQSVADVPPLLFPAKTNPRTELLLLRRWIQLHRIDAVMCNWNSIFSMLARIGYSAPKRIGCVCLCRGPGQKQLAGIVPNFDLVGQRAVSLLGSLIDEPEECQSPAPLTSYVEGTWHAGPSIINQA